MYTAKMNTNLKTQVVFVYCVSYVHNVQVWEYFREIRNPVWRLLQLDILGEGPLSQLLRVDNFA
jgi:hypothetical protein